MFERRRKDYTQKLYEQFMAHADDDVVGYMCQGTTILTTNENLYRHLRQMDDERTFYNNCYTYSFDDVGVRPTIGSEVSDNEKTAILFLNEEDDESFSPRYKDDATLLIFNEAASLERITEFIPIVIKYHTDANKADNSQDNKIPFILVKASINNRKVSLPNNGLFLNKSGVNAFSNGVTNKIISIIDPSKLPKPPILMFNIDRTIPMPDIDSDWRYEHVYYFPDTDEIKFIERHRGEQKKLLPKTIDLTKKFKGLGMPKKMHTSSAQWDYYSIVEQAVTILKNELDAILSSNSTNDCSENRQQSKEKKITRGI